MSADPRDLDALAMHAYHQGTPPVEWAEEHITNLLDVHQAVTAARVLDPRAFPGYCIELTTAAVARCVLGALLDAGWTYPGTGDLLGSYQPPQLDTEKRAALRAAADLLNSLPDYGVAAQKQAAAELGETAPMVNLVLRAAEIAAHGDPFREAS